jgi:uncharacterized protein YciI
MSWFVIRHTPADAAGESVFGDPRFAEHVAFLRGLQERGWLVAAGPLPDRPGSGMAVLHVPDSIDIRSLVGEDRSVTEGLFETEIQPWDVRFGG